MRSRSRSDAVACRAGNAGHPRDDLFDVARLDGHDARLADSFGACEPDHRARLVDEIDGAVGQLVVAQVARRQLGRRLERLVGVLHAVMFFVAAAQARENPPGLLDRRLVDGDLLQPPGERAILFDLLELLERRRADDAQIAGRENRLEHRREIHRAAGDGAGADRRVNLVDEENRLAAFRGAR